MLFWLGNFVVGLASCQSVVQLRDELLRQRVAVVLAVEDQRRDAGTFAGVVVHEVWHQYDFGSPSEWMPT